VLVIDTTVDDPAVPLLRQRRRLGDVLSSLTDEQWHAASRCEGWTVADVVAHLVGTNQYWGLSISCGLRGEPTRYLATFDPVATPPAMVEAFRTQAPAQVLAQYLSTVEELATVVEGLDAAAWSVTAEAPPGHIAARAVALHALWDAWIHERDIVVPLGLAHDVVDDEVAGCLQYVAGIGPSFLVTAGSAHAGSLTVAATAPDIVFTVDVGSTVVVRPGAGDGPRLTGDAVALIEGLSYRAPLEHDLAPEDAWLVGGLGDVFDVTPS